MEKQTEKDIAVNKHEVTGKIVKEIEFGENQNGTKTAKFTVSCGTAEYPNYIDCIAYGKKAKEMQEKGIESGNFVEITGSGNFYKSEVGNQFYQLNVGNIDKTEKQEVKNEIQIRGNISLTPEFFQTKNGGTIAQLNLAHNKKIGEEYKPMFFKVTVFGKAAEYIQNNPDKYNVGNEVAVKGNIKKEQYEHNNEKRYSVKINAAYIELSKERNQVVDKNTEKKAEKKEAKQEEKKTKTQKKANPKRKSNKGVSM